MFSNELNSSLPLSQDQTVKNNHLNRWQFVKRQLKDIYDENTYDNWLSRLEFNNINGNQVFLSASSRFVRDWVVNNYLDEIRRCWKMIDSNIIAVNIMVEQEQHKVENQQDTINQKNEEIIASEASASNFNLTKFNLDSKYTFDNFVVGESNKFAFAAAQSVAKMDDNLAFNPVFFYSPVGHGKTHLIQAIAHYVKQNNSDCKICYMTAERFMFQFVKSLRNKDIIAFKEYFRGVDLLIIDDLQFICGKESTQEEFFHTFNALVEDNKKIVLACDRSPSDLEGLDFRFKSRLISGLVADISKSEQDLRMRVIVKKAELQQTILPNDVVKMLATKITSSIRELEGAVNKIVAYKKFLGNDINLTSAQNLLKDLLRTANRGVDVNSIQQKIAEFFKIKLSDLLSSSRLREYARPRQLAMFLAKKHTGLSLVEIGKKFGGRDHTTVMHAIKQMEKIMDNDNEMLNNMVNIERMLAS